MMNAVLAHARLLVDVFWTRSPQAPALSLSRRVFVFSWLILAPSGILLGQRPASWFGTWRLNIAKSTLGPEPPYKRATRRIETSQGTITIVDDLVRSRGGILHLEWTGKFDGLDYPVQGVEVVFTNAYRLLNDGTCELIQKMDGEIVATARLAISPDGKTLTTVTSSKTGSARTIYERP
jgi:hypothetical protein